MNTAKLYTTVASSVRVTVGALECDTKDNASCLVRAITAYILRFHFGQGPIAIAAQVRKHHATVIHACKVIVDRSNLEPQVWQHYQNACALLGLTPREEMRCTRKPRPSAPARKDFNGGTYVAPLNYTRDERHRLRTGIRETYYTPVMA